MKMVSETSKCRGRLAKYCVGNGLDIGFGGDAIVPSAITFDMIDKYADVGEHPQNIYGDARDLSIFTDNSLDYIFSSHLLEDFDEDEIIPVLKEWFRVLKPYGKLILFCPDQPTYAKHCEDTGQIYNECHKIDIFGLDYVKNILPSVVSSYKIIHQIPLIDVYSFDIVIEKL
jgi:SAM-dependent methyltransferase